jgi:hypothetical protein
MLRRPSKARIKIRRVLEVRGRSGQFDAMDMLSYFLVPMRLEILSFTGLG